MIYIALPFLTILSIPAAHEHVDLVSTRHGVVNEEIRPPGMVWVGDLPEKW